MTVFPLVYVNFNVGGKVCVFREYRGTSNPKLYLARFKKQISLRVLVLLD
jgi:hypothetical protein